MTWLSLDSSTFGLAGLTRALAGVARGVGTTVLKVPAQTLKWHERRKGLEALSALTDYQLRDIGVCRSDIVMVAYGLKDPYETPQSMTVSNVATRSAPTVKKADNNDQDPCIGCAA